MSIAAGGNGSKVGSNGFDIKCSSCGTSDSVTYELRGGSIYLCCSFCTSRVNLKQIIPVKTETKETSSLELCKFHLVLTKLTGLRTSGLILLNALSYGEKTFEEIEELYSGDSLELKRGYGFVGDTVYASNKASDIDVFKVIKQQKCPRTISVTTYGEILNTRINNIVKVEYPLGFLQRVQSIAMT